MKIRQPFQGLTFLAALMSLFSVADFARAGGKLKVFILAGQSNMEGHAKVETGVTFTRCS